MPKYVLVQFDDWEKLYVDGEAVAEGHRIDARDLLRYVVGEDHEIKWYDYDSKVGKRATYDLIPEKLDELVKWETEEWNDPLDKEK